MEMSFQKDGSITNCMGKMERYEIESFQDFRLPAQNVYRLKKDFAFPF
jgi:hypothetical protein